MNFLKKLLAPIPTQTLELTPSHQQNSTEKLIQQNKLVQEIHDAFNNEGSRLLNEAKGILANDYSEEIATAERLEKLGFSSMKQVESANEIRSRINLAKKNAELVEHYAFYYPQNRFITEDSVKALCKKYDLYQAGVEKYIGDVPEENLKAIENFKIRPEDMKYYSYVPGFSLGGLTEVDYGQFLAQQEMRKKREESSEKLYQIRDYVITADKSLEICAPSKDFKLNSYERFDEETRKVVRDIPDPVVLHPVKGGYLIVTAWGLEALDPEVKAPQQN